MTLREVIEFCDQGWAGIGMEPKLIDLVDDEGQELPTASTMGDTLALFIVRELAETYDPQMDEGEQVDAAWEAISEARSELDGIQTVLEEWEPMPELREDDDNDRAVVYSRAEGSP
jgi:hypothetical protein